MDKCGSDLSARTDGSSVGGVRIGATIERRTWGILVGVLAFGFGTASQSTALRFDAPEQWERRVGWVSLANPTTSIAICPDGVVYVVGPDGAVTTISPTGDAAGSDRIDPTYRGSMACDVQRHLYLAGRQLATFEPMADGKLRLLSSMPLKSTLNRILVTPSGSVFGIRNGYTALASELIMLSSREKPLYSSRRGQLVLYPVKAGHEVLVWDQKGDRLLCVLPGEDRIEFFDDEGRHLKPPQDEQGANGNSRLLEGRSLMNVASLADGKFVIESTAGEDFVGRSTAAIQITDSSFNVISFAIRAAQVGLLLGSAADGGLYFIESRDSGEFKLVRRTPVLADAASHN